MADMQKFILGIIIVGVTLVIGIFIAATVQTTIRPAITASQINETVIINSSATVNLATYTLIGVTCGTPTVYSKNGTLLSAGNYTQSNCALTGSAAPAYWNVTDWKVTYSYNYREDSTASNASGNLTTALAGGTAWITILVVVGFAVIVLGMLSSGLGRTGSQEGQVAYTY